MARKNLIFVCCILVISGIQFCRGNSEGCGRFETMSNCVNYCNTCDPDSCRIEQCFPGCDCKPGFVWDYGQCIPKQACGYDSAVQGRNGLLGILNLGGSGCPVVPLCVSSCNARKFKDGICLGPGRELCNCFTASTTPI